MNEQDLLKLIEAINKSTTTTVESTVESVINGKIRKIDEKLTNYIHEDLKWKEDKVEPLIDAHHTIKNMGVFLKWSAGVVIAVGVLFKVITLEKV